MAIAIDDVDLGNASDNASSTTVAFNTSGTVASAGTIFLLVHYNAAATVTVAGGSLVWTEESNAVDGTQHTALFRAAAPSGLASGTTVTATMSGAATDRIIAGCSFTGLSTAAKESSGTDTQAGTAWDSASVSPISASNLVISALTLDTNVSFTPTAPNAVSIDGGATFDYHMTIVYRINSSSGSYQNVGTWAFNSLSIAATGAYGSTAAALPGDDPPMGFLGRGAGW